MSRKIIGVTVGTPISPETLKEKLNLGSDTKTAIDEINKGYLKDLNITYSLTTTIDSDDHEWVEDIPTPTAEKPYMWVWIDYTKRMAGDKNVVEEIHVGSPALVGVFNDSTSGGNANYGAENAGKLLYVGSDGFATVLALGAGLAIVDGVLTITSQVVTSAICGQAVCGKAICGGA